MAVYLEETLFASRSLRLSTWRALRLCVKFFRPRHLEPAMKEFFFAICLLSSTTAFTQPGPQISTQGALVLDQFLQSKTTSGQVPGIVALVLNKEKVIYKSASGFSRISTKESMAADKIFSIASMTKAVTTVAAMQLIEQGKIDLNDPVSKYLPAMGSIQVIEKFNPKDTSYSLRSPARPITIRDLLTHTSGSGYSFDDKTLALISQKKPAIAPSPHTGYPLIHDPGARSPGQRPRHAIRSDGSQLRVQAARARAPLRVDPPRQHRVPAGVREARALRRRQPGCARVRG